MTKMTFNKNLIWDLSGTLLSASPNQLSDQQKSDYSLLFYLWASIKAPSLLDENAVAVMNEPTLSRTPGSEMIKNPAGKAIPEIIYRFLAGIYTSKEASLIITSSFEKWKEKNSLLPEKELYQIKKMLEAFFDPYAISSCFTIQPQALTLLQKTAHNPFITNYALSNWDNESFELIYQKYKQSVFSFIKKEHVIISGSAHYLKPQEEIFRYFLKTFNLSAESCFFIDDQKENIEAARSVKIEGAVFKPSDKDLFKNLLQKLSSFTSLSF